MWLSELMLPSVPSISGLNHKHLLILSIFVHFPIICCCSFRFVFTKSAYSKLQPLLEFICLIWMKAQYFVFLVIAENKKQHFITERVYLKFWAVLNVYFLCMFSFFSGVITLVILMRRTSNCFAYYLLGYGIYSFLWVSKLRKDFALTKG